MNQVHPGSKNISPSTTKVLVLDDDVMIRKVTRILLSRLGYKPVYARNGHEAIRLYHDAIKEDKPFKLVIIDLTIPGSMGGWEVFQKLKKIDPSICAIVSSGHYNDPIMAEYKKYGFRGRVAKPYNIQELIEVIRDILKEELVEGEGV